jgi:hypothetical protein
MKRLSFAAALMVLLALTPLSFAQENSGESASPGYGESSGEPNPSMEGEEGSGQAQEGADPGQHADMPDNPDSGEMQNSPSDEGSADQDNTNQGNSDSDNPDSGSQNSGESAQPSDAN